MKKYTNRKLEQLSRELVFPGPSAYYANLTRAYLKANGLAPTKSEEENICEDLYPFELWSDLSAIINDLATLLLEERDEKEQVVADVKNTLQRCLQDLKKK